MDSSDLNPLWFGLPKINRSIQVEFLKQLSYVLRGEFLQFVYLGHFERQQQARGAAALQMWCMRSFHFLTILDRTEASPSLAAASSFPSSRRVSLLAAAVQSKQ